MPSDSIQDLFADKGDIRGTGTVVEQPKAAGDPGTIHHVESLTYLDKAGHIHAVLVDTITTAAGGSAFSTTIEILADVVVTPPPG